MAIRIGDLARDAGTSTATIRYYESIGILGEPSRSEGGYREYSARTRQELLFVRKAQAIGFSLDEIREILKLTRGGKVPCSRVRDIGHRHLAALDDRIATLRRFRNQLAREVERWDGQVTSTCDGFCQLISSVDDEITAPTEAITATPRRTGR